MSEGGCGVRSVPTKDAGGESLRRRADCATVIGGGDLPEKYLGVQLLNLARVTRGNVAVDFTVDEQDRNGSR